MNRTLIIALVLLTGLAATASANETKALRLPWFGNGHGHGHHGGYGQLPPEIRQNRLLWIGKIDGIIDVLQNAWIAPISRARGAVGRLSREVRTYGNHGGFNRELVRQLNFVHMMLQSDDACKHDAIRSLRGVRHFIGQSLR